MTSSAVVLVFFCALPRPTLRRNHLQGGMDLFCSLAMGLWWGKTAHWWEYSIEETALLMTARKQWEGRGARDMLYPLKAHPRDLCPPAKPYLFISITSAGKPLQVTYLRLHPLITCPKWHLNIREKNLYVSFQRTLPIPTIRMVVTLTWVEEQNKTNELEIEFRKALSLVDTLPIVWYAPRKMNGPSKSKKKNLT